MSGVQGIVFSGEAPESDEEEEFCVAQAKGKLILQRAGGVAAEGRTAEWLDPEQHRRKQPSQEHLKRTQTSILHLKLWDANSSLERNLRQCICAPLREQSSSILQLSGTFPAAQTSTLSAQTSLTQASHNLSRMNFLLAGLKDNPLSSLKLL